LSTAAQPPDAAQEPDPAADRPTTRRSLGERLRSPTLRDIFTTVAGALIIAVIGFAARESWRIIHKPAPSGTIDYRATVDAFVSRGDFYRRFLDEPPPPPPVSSMGAVFAVQPDVQHATSCSFVYTARDVGDQQTVGDLVDEPIPDVSDSSDCSGPKRVWIPWPCVPSETKLQFEIGVVARSKQLDSATTETFTIGGSC